MSTDAYIEMVYRNLKGELSPEAFAELNALTAKDEKLAQLRVEIEDAWDLTGDEKTMVTPKETKRLLDRLTAEKKKTSVFTLNRLVSGIAALLILVMGAMWLMRDQTITYSEAGEIILADNTVVELRGGSTLEVKPFNASSRDVVLKGEAFFKVAKDSQRPFTVYTQKTNVKVLGTSFLVKEYEKSVFVYLTEGKVLFAENDSERSMEMTPGMKVEYTAEGLKEVEFHNLASWKDGLMQYNNQELSYVLNEMEIVFGTEITLENTELSNCLINAILTSESVDLALNQLAGQLRMNVKQNGQGWTLSNGRCN